MATDVATEQANAIPRLEAGDCLPRDEFEKRLAAMPKTCRAELVEGIVFMQAAVRFEQHGEPHADLLTLFGVYRSMTPGVRAADNTSNRLDAKNEPQPDCMLFIDPAYGGQVVISEDDYVEGAPELVAEISTSSVSYDSGPKCRAYERNGVREYWIWRVMDRAIECQILRNGAFEPLSPDDAGVIRSETFPGLWIDTASLLAGNLAEALATLQLGIASAEHAVFREQQQSQNK